MSPSPTVHEYQYDSKYLARTRDIQIDRASGICGGGTSVVYLEPARINEETETRQIGREDITICWQGSSGQVFSSYLHARRE